MQIQNPNWEECRPPMYSIVHLRQIAPKYPRKFPKFLPSLLDRQYPKGGI